jgi:hypothetical protein
MLFSTLEQFEKLEKVQGKCKVILIAGSKAPKVDIDDVTHVNLEPGKEFIELAAAKGKKKAIKEYVKAILKDESFKEQLIASRTIVNVATSGKKAAVLLFDEKDANHEFKYLAVKALFKALGLEPVRFKDLKKAKAFKGKKKEAAKRFAKLMVSNTKVSKDGRKAIAKIDQQYGLDLLLVEMVALYQNKDKIKKDEALYFLKKFKKYSKDLNKKKSSKLDKQIKKFLKFDLDLPKYKKFQAGKVKGIDLMLIIGHLAAIKSNEFASAEYFKEMKGLLEVIGITPKAYQDAIASEVAAKK